MQIVSICESFIGCVQGTHMTTSGQLFNYMQPVMNTMVDMMGLYHNYSNIVELLLEIYCEAAKRMLCYLTTSASRHLYQQTINLIQVYAINNQVSLPRYIWIFFNRRIFGKKFRFSATFVSGQFLKHIFYAKKFLFLL